jgi:hypothetical protein
MSNGNLEKFGAYQKALELFDCVVDDTAQFLGHRKLERLVSQQLASADSVCSNIEIGKLLCPSPFEKGGSRGICSARTKIPPTPLCQRGGFMKSSFEYRRFFGDSNFWQRKLLTEEINRILSATIKRLTSA